MQATPIAIGTRLRHIREDAALTQQALAELAGVAVNTIIRAEAGEPLHGFSKVRIARALNRERLDLFPEPEPEEATA